MLVVSHRPALLDTVRAWQRLPSPSGLRRREPRIVTNPYLIDRQRPQDGEPDPDNLVVDLGCGDLCSQYFRMVRRWHADFPACGLLYVLPLLNPSAEIALLTQLVRAVGGVSLVLRECDIVDGEEVKVPVEVLAERLNAALRATINEQVFLELQDQLLEAVGEAQIIEQTSVLNVLRQAPTVFSYEDYCTWKGQDRRSAWRKQQVAGQRACTELIRAFRLLWAVRLRELGWSPGHVARFMGYEDASECARRIGAVFELGKREVDQLSTRTVIACYANLLVRTVTEGTFNTPEGGSM